jgi:integrase
MLFRLVSPVKRSGTENRQFVQRIPQAIRAKAAGRTFKIELADEEFVTVTIAHQTQTVRFSLRTSNASEAKRRQARAAAALERIWESLRDTEPVTLSHRQATALSGKLYRAWVDEQSSHKVVVEHAPTAEDPRAFRIARPTHEDEIAAAEAGLRLFSTDMDNTPAQKRLDDQLYALADRILLEEGIANVTLESRNMLIMEFRRALRDAFEQRRRNTEGDYSPDPKAERFPEWVPPKAEGKPRPNNAKVSLTKLVDDWWKEAQKSGRKPSTYESYRNTVSKLRLFLRHDDASRVTPEDVVRFKDHRLKTASPKTVKDSDLAGLKTTFSWAVTNRRLKTNPADGITLKVGKSAKLRSKGFTDAEAKAILSAASSYVPDPRESKTTAAAKRWVPWILAYTGARVGEIAQLRKQDVRQEGDLWVIRITPEAGTVKTNEARDVVLHPHLVELGFPAFVANSPSGHLFLKLSRKGNVAGPLQALKNRLAEFSRALVPDKNVAPNHGWRHRFKTVGMEAGIDHRILDGIQGQSARSVAETYGDVTLKVMARAIASISRIQVQCNAIGAPKGRPKRRREKHL